MKQKILIKMSAILMTIAVVFSCVLWVEMSGSQVRPVEKEYASTLFQKNKIMEVNIIMDEDEWQDMLDNAKDETYVPCDVEVNGVTYKNVAIRPKGNTSLTQVTNDRYSFKIQFDEYQSGQTCDGLDQLVLNNNYSDATYMKEYLAYDMFQYMGVVTPLYSYADVKVNGETYGLYLALEGVKESFAERNYGVSHGELYKPESTNAGGENAGGNEGGKNMRPDNRTSETDANTSASSNSTPSTSDSSNTDTANNSTPSTSDNSNTDTANNSTPPTSDNSNTDTANNSTSPTSDSSNLDTQNNSTATTDESTTNSTENASMGAPSQGGTPPDGNGQEQEKNSMKDPLEQAGNQSSSSGTDLVYTDDNANSYSAIFDNAVFDLTTAKQNSLISALKGISSGENLEEYMDVEATLKYFAVNTVLVNYDSYTGNLKHNYYLYEKDGMLTMLPWDLNLAFAGYQSNNATSAVNDPIDTPVSGTTLEERPMIGQLLSNETYMEQYHQYMDSLITGYIESGRYETVITELKGLISDYVKNDPNAFYSYDEYVEAVENLEKFIELRGESVRGQLDGTIPSTEEEQKTNSDALIEAGDLSITAMGVMGGGQDQGNMGGRGTMPSNGNNTNTSSNETTTNESSNTDKTTDESGGNTPSNGTDNGNTPPTPPSGTENGTMPSTPPSGTENGTMPSTPPGGTENGTMPSTPPGGTENGTDSGNAVTTPSNGEMNSDSENSEDSNASSDTTQAEGNMPNATDNVSDAQKPDMKNNMAPRAKSSRNTTKTVVLVAVGCSIGILVIGIFIWKFPRKKYRS